MTIRNVQQIIQSIPASDGAGVKLRRSLGQSQYARLDPFLMLDEFSSDDAADYIAGFPAHPHRGFETVTYILDGHMLHEDHLGNKGNLRSGGVQWMTAGRGIIHSEMPQQDRGRMRGFQLWINLPAKDKMRPASYRDLEAADIPEVALAGGGKVRLIAGDYAGTRAPVSPGATDATYFDVHLPAGATFKHAVKDGYNAFAYVYEGALDAIPEHSAAVFSTEGEVQVRAGAQGARFLLLAGRPLREPVVQYGPFVMNTREEIEQAIRDYQNGTLATS
ncbi:MAG TPA: pirin family protein [Burkholderiales bacterium]|nr:pirin family protein [Burkholderiales bacterium]